MTFGHYQVDSTPSVVLVVHGPVAPRQELEALVVVDLELVGVRPSLEFVRIFGQEQLAFGMPLRWGRDVPLAPVQDLSL